MGEFYFDKLRYADAAAVYDSFVERYPYHRVSPEFSMRVIGIYEGGDFPKLVVESKKSFATKYGLQGEYWQHFDSAERPEVLAYLKTNLEDLANHYHALYQEPRSRRKSRRTMPRRSSGIARFSRRFHRTSSRPTSTISSRTFCSRTRISARPRASTSVRRTPTRNTARRGGRLRCDFRAPRAAQRSRARTQEAALKRATVESSLRFADTFPEHEYAAVVLGAAAEDLYALEDYAAAATAGRALIERYPTAEVALRRTAWSVVAHSSFELADYLAAEPAYSEVLALTPPEDEGRQALVDNLAASIYKQGEQANEAQDYRAAAGHFLRITEHAPTSSIRPSAEYDAAAALMKLQDWTAAAGVLDAFRAAFPEHELNSEATKQLAFVYREGGKTSLAAAEYERVAAEAADPELGERRCSRQASSTSKRATSTVRSESTNATSQGSRSRSTSPSRRARRSPRCIAHAATSLGTTSTSRRSSRPMPAPAPSARTVRAIWQRRPGWSSPNRATRLSTPCSSFNRSSRISRASASSWTRRCRTFERLIAYEVAEVTTAATFYMAEIYSNFSRSLLDSERPTGLHAAELAAYEDAIEEEAFPFEERAIEVHEANIEVMIAAGVYNRWIEQSFARLGDADARALCEGRAGPGRLGRHRDVYLSRAERRRARGGLAPPAEPERRARPQAQKGPAIRLDVLAGAGFTITDATRVSPELRERYLAATGYLEQGLYERGVAELEAVTQQAPDLANPHVDLGLAYARTGRFAEAAASVERALALSADSSDRARRAWPDLSQAGAIRGRARAVRAGARAVSRFPSREPESRDPLRFVSARLRLRVAALRGVPSARARRPRRSPSGSPTLKGRVSP